jgi:hypothetical protein
MTTSANKVTWKDWTVEIGYLVMATVVHVIGRLERFEDTLLGQWYVRLGIIVAVIVVFEFLRSPRRSRKNSAE